MKKIIFIIGLYLRTGKDNSILVFSDPFLKRRHSSYTENLIDLNLQQSHKLGTYLSELSSLCQKHP